MTERVQGGLPSARWYAAIPERRSRRQYIPQPLEPEAAERLRDLCADFAPFRGARAVMVQSSPERVFKGAVGPYGKIKGAPAFVAFVGQSGDPHVQEKAGYLGEGIILEATALGLATCWVGGFFRPEVAASLTGAERGERVLAVTPVGYAGETWSFEERVMAGFGRSHRRKPLAELVSGLEEQAWPAWVKSALEAARLAPSAVNRQPWRFQVEAGRIVLSVDNTLDTYGISKRLDCGIAMLHIEVACGVSGVSGGWTLLDQPQVACWSAPSGQQEPQRQSRA